MEFQTPGFSWAQSFGKGTGKWEVSYSAFQTEYPCFPFFMHSLSFKVTASSTRQTWTVTQTAEPVREAAGTHGLQWCLFHNPGAIHTSTSISKHSLDSTFQERRDGQFAREQGSAVRWLSS